MLATDDLQTAKSCVRALYDAMDAATPETIAEVLAAHTDPAYHWRGMYPFYEQTGPAAVAQEFWAPLMTSLTHLQRRTDIFFAGRNDCDGFASVWVCSMGHYMGLFDQDLLGIPATHRIAMLRHAEFHRVVGNRIVETALFCDLLGLMHQAGVYPLPPATGAHFVYPGPRTQDGLLYAPQDPTAGAATLELIDTMIADLDGLNQRGDDRAGPELLARTWHEDMIWYGPFGIGATYTIPRYQEQHTFPFRLALEDKTFNGHVARFAEGDYGGFFGWPNLTNTSIGGLMGLPGSQVPADMRVVDVYRRAGDKLAENWVFIDVPHYLHQQGLDILERNRQLRRLSSV